MASIDGQFSHDKFEGEGKTSYLCGPIPPTTELGNGINGAGASALLVASRGAGVRISPYEPWLCQPHDRTQ